MFYGCLIIPLFWYWRLFFSFWDWRLFLHCLGFEVTSLLFGIGGYFFIVWDWRLFLHGLGWRLFFIVWDWRLFLLCLGCRLFLLCLGWRLFLLCLGLEVISSSVNGRFRVKTTEVRRVHMYSSLLVVTSNQNASNKKRKSFKYIP